MASAAHRQGEVVGAVGTGSLHLPWAVQLTDSVCAGSDVRGTLQQGWYFLNHLHHLTRVLCVLSCGLVLAQLWGALCKAWGHLLLCQPWEPG